MTQDQVINAFAVAIAYAEGFYINGSRPQRNNNPGDLTVDIIGRGVGFDGPFVVYSTPNDGWEALRAQVGKIINNTSSIYNSNMTIAEIAQRYTTTEQSSWALNVANKLGVSPDTRIGDLIQTAENVAIGGGIGIGVVVIIAVLFYLSRKN